VPELPEVQALAEFLTDRCRGRHMAGVELAAISALKTFDPPVTAFAGLAINGVSRHGKFLDLDADGLHLVVHLARGGWIRWSEQLPRTPAKPGKGPLALRVRLDDGSGFDVTEAGTQKRLSVSVVLDPADVPGISRLGPDPLADDFDQAALDAIRLAHPRQQLKGLLRDQRLIAGVGNAYSDEILHAARMSPFKPAGNLSPEEAQDLYQALRDVLSGAVAAARGLEAAELKDGKRLGMRVHGRTGQDCPVCGDKVREVSYADSALQYCPTCQTGGKPLADRRLSRLLR